MVRAYNELMKSGNFTAAQNKSDNGDVVDSISEIVAICEKDGFIPRYYTEGPQDKVDRVIEDNQRYLRTLVTEEMGLENLIENAIKQLKTQKEHEEAIYDDDDGELFNYENTEELTEADYEEFQRLQQEMENEDLNTFDEMEQGGNNGIK